MLCSFWGAATAAVGGQGEDYARDIEGVKSRCWNTSGGMGCDLYVSVIYCLRLAGRVVLIVVGERLEPYVESMGSRWALKVRQRLVGYVGCRLGSRWSLRLVVQVDGELGEGSREARIASWKATTPG